MLRGRGKPPDRSCFRRESKASAVPKARQGVARDVSPWQPGATAWQGRFRVRPGLAGFVTSATRLIALTEESSQTHPGRLWTTCPIPAVDAARPALLNRGGQAGQNAGRQGWGVNSAAHRAAAVPVKKTVVQTFVSQPGSQPNVPGARAARMQAKARGAKGRAVRPWRGRRVRTRPARRPAWEAGPAGCTRPGGGYWA